MQFPSLGHWTCSKASRQHTGAHAYGTSCSLAFWNSSIPGCLCASAHLFSLPVAAFLCLWSRSSFRTHRRPGETTHLLPHVSWALCAPRVQVRQLIILSCTTFLSHFCLSFIYFIIMFYLHQVMHAHDLKCSFTSSHTPPISQFSESTMSNSFFGCFGDVLPISK